MPEKSNLKCYAVISLYWRLIVPSLQTWKDIFMNITTINWAATVTSLVSMVILYLVKVQINQRFKSKMRIPIPIEIIVVSFDTFCFNNFGIMIYVSYTHSNKCILQYSSIKQFHEYQKFFNKDLYIIVCINAVFKEICEYKSLQKERSFAKVLIMQ